MTHTPGPWDMSLLDAGITLAARNAALEAENARLRAALDYLDRRGGLGYREHDMIGEVSGLHREMLSNQPPIVLAVQPEPTPVIGEQLRAVLKKE